MGRPAILTATLPLLPRRALYLAHAGVWCNPGNRVLLLAGDSIAEDVLVAHRGPMQNDFDWFATRRDRQPAGALYREQSGR